MTFCWGLYTNHHVFQESTYLSHGDVPELRGKWKDSEKLNLTESGFQQLVVRLNGVMSDVEVTGNASQVCNLQVKRHKKSTIKIMKSNS